MRMDKEQIELLKNSLKSLDSAAHIYLFGSRTDDNKKGGDIDLLIRSKKLKKSDIRKLRLDFYQKFGEQKIDIILDDGKQNSAFIDKIKQQAIEL
ncbi:nucleotidyltransferase domain-containing protein [methane-oxidizing endosymbiont of Gigantopelta aegis]|uniref:nucleotidyltransferase domain-containing protein n=1 Tax=methane-oxidizing endosymbiont of Gigantopelta aegis TaxID=2794938 RepID=UPI0018DDF490|nr:nucleotidyltransferase domain-containing protein [methane-oxidizing endosymbiont of Gigantopelta aegis]